jgi:hypothetical protein
MKAADDGRFGEREGRDSEAAEYSVMAQGENSVFKQTHTALEGAGVPQRRETFM